MKIKNMTLNELTIEINRARFWIEQNSIKSSLNLINKMENKKLELINNKLKQ